jgi:hypothetical protein
MITAFVHFIAGCNRNLIIIAAPMPTVKNKKRPRFSAQFTNEYKHDLDYAL